MLKQMFRMCMIDFGSYWDQHLSLVEFFYSDSCHSSIQMALFDELLFMSCKS